MAKTPINYCYFEIEDFSSAFLIEMGICHLQCPESICKSKCWMLVCCVCPHIHAPLLFLYTLSQFFHCLQDGINNPDPKEPKGTGGCGGKAGLADLAM